MNVCVCYLAASAGTSALVPVAVGSWWELAVAPRSFTVSLLPFNNARF